MDKNVKFKKGTVKGRDGKDTPGFILEVRNIRIILSEPGIQNTAAEYSSPNELMHFYYCLTIEENKNYDPASGNKDGCEWHYLTSVFAYEEGAVRYLPYFIDEVLAFEMDDNSRHRYFTDNNGKKSRMDYECLEQFELNGAYEEDNYSVTKHFTCYSSSYNIKTDMYECSYSEYYNIFVGCGRFGCVRNGVNFRADRNDMLVIKKWASEFIDYAVSQRP